MTDQYNPKRQTDRHQGSEKGEKPSTECQYHSRGGAIGRSQKNPTNGTTLQDGPQNQRFTQVEKQISTEATTGGEKPTKTPRFDHIQHPFT